MRYDLAESTGPALRVGELDAPDLPRRLTELALGYGGPGGDDELRGLIGEILRSSAAVLAPRAAALAAALETLTDWAARHAGLVELLPPDGGALCCLRLRADAIDDDAVARFPAALAEREARVAPGHWFGDSERVFRLGFGHLPAELFGPALDRLGDALHANAPHRVG